MNQLTSFYYLLCPFDQVNGQVIIENFQDFSLINMIRLQSIPQHIMNKCFKMQSYMPFRMRCVAAAPMRPGHITCMGTCCKVYPHSSDAAMACP